MEHAKTSAVALTWKMHQIIRDNRIYNHSKMSVINSNFNTEVRVEQIRALSGHIPIIAIGTLVATGTLAYLLVNRVDSLHLSYWCAGVVTLLVCRLWFLYRFEQRMDNVEFVLRSSRYLTAFAFVSGLLWAGLPVLFIQGHSVFVLNSITIILLGMIAGSLASESVFLPAFLAFSLPVMISLSSVIVIREDSYGYLGLLGYAFFSIITGFAIRSGKVLQKSFELRFENRQLLHDLGIQKIEAEHANLAKSKFLAAASHDLRQPLYALGLYLESLQFELNTDRQRQLADKISQTNEALGELFSSLLDISRLDAGNIQHAPDSFSIGDLMQRLEDRFRPLADEKQLELTLNHDQQRVYSDPILLERVLGNLILNAIQYTANGEIRVEVSNESHFVTISVTDTGPGIARDEQDRIFDEFYQLQNPERDRSKGMGLGLSIVKRLCLLMDCSINFESAPGLGSCFSLRLPVGEDRVEDDGGEEHRQYSWNNSNFRILVIDNDLIVQQAMSDLLGSWGFQAVTVGSVSQALQSIEAGFEPELLICDYHLSAEQSGIDAINTILESLEHSVPHFLITADTDPQRQQQIEELGIALLCKPVKPSQLRLLINQKIG